MANEPRALAIRPPDAPTEIDYLTLRAALSASGRGRAFLAEHARRSRQADSAALLAAIGRIEARLQADGSAVQRLREDLSLLLIAIRLARPEIDAVGPAAKAAKLAKLLDLLERRIDAMAGVTAEAAPPAADEAPDATPAESGESARLRLVVVPPSEEPELPIPSPASAPAPAMAIVANVAAMPAAAAVESAPPAPLAETVVAPPPDPLAAIMALSEDERLALFT